MKKIRTLLFIPLVIACALALMPASAWARHVDQQGSGSRSLDEVDPEAMQALAAHDIGNVRMTLSNWGECGNPDAIVGYKGFEFPINSGNDFLFSAGVWIGAELNGVRYVSTATDGDNGTNEFWPAHIGTVPSTRAAINFGDWYVTSKNFAEFNDRDYVWGAKGIDDDGDWTTADDLDGNGEPSDNFDGGKGYLNFDDPQPLADGTFGPDGLIDEEQANGIDDDGDGQIDEDTDAASDANGDLNASYDPEPHIDEDPAGDISSDYVDNDNDGDIDAGDADSDGDANVGSLDDDGDGNFDEDGVARGVQEYFAVFHDQILPANVSNPDPEDPHDPLNLVITQRTYAFPEAYASAFILLDYRIRNVGLLPLKKAFITMFADADVGAAGEGGDAASLDDSTYYDPDRLMMVMSDNSTDQDGPGPGVFAIRVVKTPVALEQLRVTYGNFERQAGGDPPADADKYNLISSGEISPASPERGDWRMLLAFGDAAEDGFEIGPGETLPITVAFIAGGDLTEVGTNAEWALAMYLNDFQGPSSPETPEFTLDVFTDMVRIRWAANAEVSVDAITGESDFEGYVIERSTDQLNWERIAAYDKIDTLEPPFEWDNFNLGMPERCGDDTTLYCFEDRGLIPGHTYYYAVRAFDTGVLGAGVLYSGRTGNTIAAIIARNASTGAPTDLSQIYVFPNPYKGSHPGESGGQVNESKGLIEYPRKLYFMGLPATTSSGECIIRIYSLAGDYLAKIDHQNGLEYDQWDMITQNRQEIVSGIYYYVVEYGSEQFIDKFVVIK